jgi:hypothetical protein
MSDSELSSSSLPRPNLLVMLGDGWHMVEHYNNQSWIWSTNEAELWLRYSFEMVEIDVDCYPLNVNPLVVVKNGTQEETVPLVAGMNTLKIPAGGVKSLKIRSTTFIPKDSAPGSLDTRSLGVRMCAVRVCYNNTSYSLTIDNIQSKRYVELKSQCDLAVARRASPFHKSRKFTSMFDKVYCISKPDDYARRLHALRQFESYGIAHEFVSAISADIIPPTVINITKPEASLCYTAMMCLQNAKMNGYTSVVIMEDDFKFIDGWSSVFDEFAQHLPSDWDLLYLGEPKCWNGISDRRIEFVNDYVDRVKFGCGAHFMAINSSIYDTCINLIGSMTDKMDVCYWNIMRDSSYNCYSPKTSLADSISAPDKVFASRIPGFTITDYLPSRLSNLPL